LPVTAIAAGVFPAIKVPASDHAMSFLESIFEMAMCLLERKKVEETAARPKPRIDAYQMCTVQVLVLAWPRRDGRSRK
jgi:hypothetical protein